MVLKIIGCLTEDLKMEPAEFLKSHWKSDEISASMIPAMTCYLVLLLFLWRMICLQKIISLFIRQLQRMKKLPYWPFIKN
ncbi:MAG TPA: hypothetical protein DD400_00270 [Rhodospirillaceae bacterium]|nr:hypothetical protein [Rhodospirillaceae bacterium]